MLNCCITGKVCFLFRGYVSYETFHTCAVSCFKWYSQFVVFSRMYKITIRVLYLQNVTTLVQFQPNQQKCSLLQAIPEHVSI